MTTASDPSQRAYSFLQGLAADLSKRQISFPTFTGATLRVRTALNDPTIDAERLDRGGAGDRAAQGRQGRAGVSRAGRMGVAAQPRGGGHVLRADAQAVAAQC